MSMELHKVLQSFLEISMDVLIGPHKDHLTNLNKKFITSSIPCVWKNVSMLWTLLTRTNPCHNG